MKLYVKGYKSISSEVSIELPGLTVVSGANSSGKSSFMQPFLILKQTLERHFDNGYLNINDEVVSLTDSSQIFSMCSDTPVKSFTVGYKNKNLHLNLLYRAKDGKGVYLDEMSFEELDSKTSFNVCSSSGTKHLWDVVSKIDNGKALGILDNILKKGNFKPKIKLLKKKGFMSIDIRIAGDESGGSKNKTNKGVGMEISPVDSLKQLVSSIIHIPGLRGNPSRTYRVNETEDSYPGSFEKYVSSFIEKWKINNDDKYEKLIGSLQDLGLTSGIKADRKNETSIEIKVSPTKKSIGEDRFVSIADVGFGVSQALPILVGLIAAKKGQVIFIEQPELHLHPKAQYELSKVIVDAVKRGVLVVIETHSSIMIRGFQLQVANNTIKPEKFSLNWFTQCEITGESIVTNSGFDSVGSYEGWPVDFDDITLKLDSDYLDAVEASFN